MGLGVRECLEAGGLSVLHPSCSLLRNDTSKRCFNEPEPGNKTLQTRLIPSQSKPGAVLYNTAVFKGWSTQSFPFFPKQECMHIFFSLTIHFKTLYQGIEKVTETNSVTIHFLRKVPKIPDWGLKDLAQVGHAQFPKPGGELAEGMLCLHTAGRS